ncbi:M16 family metallopeptidase [Sideroxydans lithotrophicus]|uniref:Peptidase M16 domain protein n=1 Tax=Sideroxydans lithotrophicus (strain ES-1) TaxID=580332 RepID=D5CLZ9_SIDLE|nr:pitrilysin family protein [Sideroxydans lithotrophicus]ADE12594.1 peptidase M16 domain protein [Sideroxydans lithotrophicus ES-1]
MFTRFLTTAVLLCVATGAFATPQIQHWHAPSGARVYFVEDHGLPMLDVAVSFPAGSGFDVAGKVGVSSLTFGMLDLGAQGLSEDDISRKLADIGAQMGGQFDPDRAGLTMRTLSSAAERNAALDIMGSCLQQPLFPETILTREKARLIASLKEEETRPESIADKAFGKAVFGAHPYGWHMEVADVEKIQRDELESFYHDHYSARHAVVALMGDVTRAQAEAIAQQLTANLPAGGASAQIAPVLIRIKPSEQRIPHPATQSHILIGTPGIARNDEDYFPLYVGNYILGGGGFVSRLMNEVREKRGMAYSVYSYFMPMQQPGAFQIGLQTKKEQADESLRLVRETLRTFIDKGVTEKELRAAKQNITGGFPLRIDSNRKILDYLSVIGFYELPLTYLDDFTDKVNKVTTKQIHDAFKRRIDPDALATVIVGAPVEANPQPTTGRAEMAPSEEKAGAAK